MTKCIEQNHKAVKLIAGLKRLQQIGEGAIRDLKAKLKSDVAQSQKRHCSTRSEQTWSITGGEKLRTELENRGENWMASTTRVKDGPVSGAGPVRN